MSKFPALEDFDEDLANQETNIDNEEDFLSREKAVLGDDAQAFNSQGGDQDPDQAGFEASFPALDSQNNESSSALGPTGLISEPAEPYLPNQPSDQAATEGVNKLSLEDSEPIKEWKARRELEIQRRDELSESKRKETREKAMKAIDDFYENYNSKKDDGIEQNRAEEKKFIEERDNAVTTVGNTWERIVKLIDTSDKGVKSSTHDKTRFRELLMSLRGDSNAPGAGGY
uniref:Clathrin light chain n=1 Tax=Blastobotrys adeninivorans TaxID=409370 RepID=A0A060TER0_BLAAD